MFENFEKAVKSAISSPLAWKAMGDIVIVNPSVCMYAWGVCRGVYVHTPVPVWLGFCYSDLLWKIKALLQPNLGQRCSWDLFIC